MERKEEIILAALELASENGLQSVSMNQIAEKIRIKAPSLYNHFKSKDEIVRAMYSYLREQAQQNRSFGFADPDAFASKSLEQILTESLASYLGMIADQNMMRLAGISCAPRNAKKPVKQAASFVTESNDRDGVAHAVIKYVNV